MAVLPPPDRRSMSLSETSASFRARPGGERQLRHPEPPGARSPRSLLKTQQSRNSEISGDIASRHVLPLLPTTTMMVTNEGSHDHHDCHGAITILH